MSDYDSHPGEFINTQLRRSSLGLDVRRLFSICLQDYSYGHGKKITISKTEENSAADETLATA